MTCCKISPARGLQQVLPQLPPRCAGTDLLHLQGYRPPPTGRVFPQGVDPQGDGLLVRQWKRERTIQRGTNQDTLDCAELNDTATAAARRARWQAEADRNGGTHPLVRPADTRLLRRMRAAALPPLQGGGLSDAMPVESRDTVPG